MPQERHTLLFRSHRHPANEELVGNGMRKAMEEFKIPRESIFLTTKLNNPDMGRPKEALEYSLKQLDTPYLDLCEFRLSCRENHI